MRVRRRPFTRLGIAMLAAHGFFELGAGVGMPGASILGALPAATLWAVGILRLWRTTRRAGVAVDRRLAVANGLALAAALAHFRAWPRERGRRLPWLRTCEGLEPRLMRYYNPILYGSLVGGVGGLLRENPSARAVGAAMLTFVPLLQRLQHAEFRRLCAIAAAHPAWWNRRLQRRIPRRAR